MPPGSVATVTLKVAELGLGKKDILIIDIFSSAVYMGSDEMGMPVAAFQSEPGKYHISGHLEAAPYAMLKRRFAAIRPILEAAGKAVIVCMLPLPRFILWPCCDNTRHETPDTRQVHYEGCWALELEIFVGEIA